jgi:N-acyl-D-aspartate/D-glutamate deacylase
MRHVIVNGRVVVADGELTKETPGRRLRRGR